MAGQDASILKDSDHMRDMQATRLEIVALSRPSSCFMRLTVRVETQDLQAWARPNVAIRLEIPGPEGQGKASRVYTIRSFDAPTATATIDFVVHDHPSPVMTWLSGVQIGDSVAITGPRPHFLPNYAAGKPCLILADDSALPAVHAILDHWPEGAVANVFVSTADPRALDTLPVRAGVAVHVVPSPGTDGEPMPLLARARAFPGAGECTIWAAGERDEARALRRHFADIHGLGREDIRIYGYWKRGISNTEIDRERLAHYAALRAAGGALGDTDDLDIPV